MAYVNTTRAAQPSFFDRVSTVFASLAAANRRRAVYNQTVRELNGLSERELTDLGLHRSAISEIAATAAYKI